MFRSQVAEAIFNSDPALGWEAFSSGTAVQQEEREGIKLSEWGAGVQVVINEVQKKYHKDISDQFCKQVDENTVMRADKIIMMSEREFIPPWLNTYEWEYWEVPNPDVISPNLADEIIELLDKKITILKKALS